jgi:hypothetical protein
MPAKSDGQGGMQPKKRGSRGKSASGGPVAGSCGGEKNYYQLLVRIYGGRKFPAPEEGAKSIALECRCRKIWSGIMAGLTKRKT